MDHFKIEPSKKVGIIKEKIKNSILDGKIKNNFNDAYELMKKIGNSLGLK